MPGPPRRGPADPGPGGRARRHRAARLAGRRPRAPDHPLVVAAVERLAEAGIPVVTLVTDLPTCRPADLPTCHRVAYVDLRDRVRDALAADPDIAAGYSMYAFGGNAATLAAFADARRTCRAFIAQDLDAENLALLQKDSCRRCCTTTWRWICAAPATW